MLDSSICANFKTYSYFSVNKNDDKAIHRILALKNIWELLQNSCKKQKCEFQSLKFPNRNYSRKKKIKIRDHSFSTEVKFSEKLVILTLLYAHVYIYVSGGIRNIKEILTSVNCSESKVRTEWMIPN